MLSGRIPTTNTQYENTVTYLVRGLLGKRVKTAFSIERKKKAKTKQKRKLKADQLTTARGTFFKAAANATPLNDRLYASHFPLTVGSLVEIHQRPVVELLQTGRNVCTRHRTVDRLQWYQSISDARQMLSVLSALPANPVRSRHRVDRIQNITSKELVPVSLTSKCPHSLPWLLFFL